MFQGMMEMIEGYIWSTELIKESIKTHIESKCRLRVELSVMTKAGNDLYL